MELTTFILSAKSRFPDLYLLDRFGYALQTTFNYSLFTDIPMPRIRISGDTVQPRSWTWKILTSRVTNHVNTLPEIYFSRNVSDPFFTIPPQDGLPQMPRIWRGTRRGPVQELAIETPTFSSYGKHGRPVPR